jgi:hypothetical protein
MISVHADRRASSSDVSEEKRIKEELALHLIRCR